MTEAAKPGGNQQATAGETKTTESTTSTTTTTDQPKAGAGDSQAKPGDTKTETKTDETGTKPGDKAGAAEEKPKVPEKYELTIPDDSKPFVDDAILERFKQTAKTAQMTNEEAQAFLEDQITFVRSQAQAWETETKADPTYGGDKLPETQKLAQRFIDRIRPDGHPRRDSFLKFLARGGAGNNLDVVSALADAGRLMSEDSGPAGRTGGGGGARTNEDKAAILYDNPDSKAADAAGRS